MSARRSRWTLHRAACLPPLLRLGGEARALLDRETGVEHALFVEGLADDLQAERQPFAVEPGRHRHGRKARKAGGHGEDVVEVHRQRVVELLAELERRRRRRGRDEHVGLLERGASLVADDMVRVKLVGGELVATSPDLSRGYMEIRGIGIINVANLYGLASIRPDKRLDLVVTLKPHADLNEVDRLGLRQKTHEILGQHVTHVEIPIAPGRDTARMVTIAALDQQLRRLGYNMADEFNQRLLDHMADQ